MFCWLLPCAQVNPRHVNCMELFWGFLHNGNCVLFLFEILCFGYKYLIYIWLKILCGRRSAKRLQHTENWKTVSYNYLSFNFLKKNMFCSGRSNHLHRRYKFEICIKKILFAAIFHIKKTVASVCLFVSVSVRLEKWFWLKSASSETWAFSNKKHSQEATSLSSIRQQVSLHF